VIPHSERFGIGRRVQCDRDEISWIGSSDTIRHFGEADSFSIAAEIIVGNQGNSN